MNRFLSTAYRMLRLRVLVTVLIFGYLGALSSNNLLGGYVFELLMAVLALAFWYLNGTCINDLADEDIDKINLKDAPSRPLINHKTSRRTLWLLALAGGVFSLACAYAISLPAFILLCAALALNWVYSMPPVRVSYRGVIAPLLLPMGYVALPFLLGLFSADGKLDGFSSVLLAGMYLSFVGRIVLKDLRDVEGDKKYGKKTFIVRYGKQKTMYFSGFFWLAGTVVLAVLFASRSWLLCAILITHMLVVSLALQRMGSAKSRHVQQVILGAIGQIAAMSMLCIAIWLIYDSDLYDMSGKSYLYLSVLLGVYGAVYGLFVIRNPEEMKVSY